MRKLLFAGAIILGMFAISGCSEDDLGRYCVAGYRVSTAEPGTMVYNTEAPECIDRLCILQVPTETAAQQNPDLNPIQFCSHECSKDSDCGGPTDDCPDGFVCTQISAGALAGSCACTCKSHYGGDYAECGQ